MLMEQEEGGESVEEDIIVDDGPKPVGAAVGDASDAPTSQDALQHLCAQAEVIAEQSVGESFHTVNVHYHAATSPHRTNGSSLNSP